MADNAVNIFDKYGIKEVANVYFEALESDPAANIYKGDIVLFLDTLKVSTIETSAEQTDARGGWGNPKLISWDYGKEITVTLTDALISLESLRFMLGGAIKTPKADAPVYVHHTEEVVCKTGGLVPLPVDHLTKIDLTPKAYPDHPIRLINLTTGTRTQIKAEAGNVVTMSANTPIYFKNPAMLGNSELVPAAENDVIRIFWEEKLTGSTDTETAVEVTISPSTFPGTYKVVGDTFIRSQKTGADEPFQFIINKAKVASNVTFTLEAEGDPSTFELTLNVLRSDDAGETEMMKLVRYSVTGSTSSDAGDDFGSFSSGGSGQ